VATLLGDISEDGLKYQLAKLKKRGLIRRIGPDKGGRWEVLNSWLQKYRRAPSLRL
jgi:ATP-dependent DNA helicase RecG